MEDDNKAGEHADNAVKDGESSITKAIDTVEEVAESAIGAVEDIFGIGSHQDPSARSSTVNTPINPNAVYPGDEADKT
jgi:hypothetical protein